MSDIALRDYDYEIEAMIESGEIDEAIAHCQYILTKYPKHVGVYRLLGDSLVHAGRQSEAIKIFHRLLSALPDDFEAHYDLGLLYTYQRDFDPALWHTLRAFELQPSNKSVHEKLRDLYILRDGKSPQIRLTRPALARMYASQPDQIEQAISEILSILADEPDRVDLEVLLAQIYHRDQMYLEAIDTCISILNRLPFCLEANLILAETYELNGQAEEAEVHWARVKEIDPYDKRFEKHSMEKNGLLVVDDCSLQPLKEQEAKTARQEKQIDIIPNGIEISPLVTVDNPETEIGKTPQGSVNLDASSRFMEQKGTGDEDNLVEGISSAASSESEPELLLPDFSFLNEVDEGPAFISPEELPAWLQDIQPQQTSGEIENPPFLETKSTQELSTGSDSATQRQRNTKPSPDLPEWLINLAAKKEMKAQEETIPTATSQGIIPEDHLQAQSVIQHTEELPSWLREIEALPSVVTDALPSIVIAPPPPPETPQEQLPSWLRELDQIPDIPAAKFPELSQNEDTDTWLQKLDQIPGAPKTEFVETPQNEEFPSFALEPDETPGAPKVESPESLQERNSDSWLQELDQIPGAPKAEDLKAPQIEETDNWLRELDEIPGALQAEDMKAPQIEQTDTWLRELDEIPGALQAEDLKIPQKEETDTFQRDLDQIPGAPKTEDLKAPQIEETDTWLRELDEIPGALQAEDVKIPQIEETDTFQRDLDQIPGAPKTEDLKAPQIEETDTWLRELDEIPGALKAEALKAPQIEEMEPFQRDLDQIPGSLKAEDLKAPQIGETDTFLRELDQIPGVPKTEALKAPQIEETDTWLRELDEIPGAPKAEDLKIPQIEEMDTFLRELEEIPDVPKAESTETHQEEETDPWLRELDKIPDFSTLELPKTRAKERAIASGQQIEEEATPPMIERETANIKDGLPAWLRELEDQPEMSFKQPEEIEAQISYNETAEIEQPVELAPLDWMSPIADQAVSQAEPPQIQPVGEGIPSWLKDLDKISAQPTEEPIETIRTSESSDWAIIREEISADLAGRDSEMQAPEELPDWLKDLEGIGTESPTLQPDEVELSLPVPSEAGITEIVLGSEHLEITPPPEIEEPSFEVDRVASWTIEEKDIQGAPIPDVFENIPDWLQPSVDFPALSQEEITMLEVVPSMETPSKPEFENIGAAIDWLENVTTPTESEGTDILSTVPEAEISASMTQDMIEIEEMDTYPPIHPRGAKWVLEAAPLDMGVPTQLLDVRSQLKGEGRFHEITGQPQPKGLLNINKASLSQLEKLPGMGFRQAQNILNYRQVKGEIHSLEELRHLPKIDPKLLMDIESNVIFTDPEPEPSVSSFELSKIEILGLAQAYMSQGNIPSALEQYSLLISNRSMLDEIISNLKIIGGKAPQDIQILETLGEAYLVSERYEEALETYRQAEEILQ